MTVGPGAAQDDAIVQADEITSDGIDPEEETALGTGRVNPGQRSRRHGDARTHGRTGRGAGGRGVSTRIKRTENPPPALPRRSTRQSPRAPRYDQARPFRDRAGSSTMAAACAARAPRWGHWAAAPGPIAAICCQARVRACRAAGCSGTLTSTASAAARICGHFPSESAA